MPDPIVIQSGDQTVVIEPEENVDPVVQELLYRGLEIYGRDQGFDVTTIDPDLLGTARSFAPVQGGGFTGEIADLEGVEETIRFLNANADTFSPTRGDDFRDVFAELRNYEELVARQRAAGAAGAASAAARERERLIAEERARRVKAATRAEEDRRFAFDQAAEGRAIAGRNEQREIQRDAISRSISSIARRADESAEQFALQRDNLRLNTEGFERDTSLAGDPSRQVATALGAGGSPVQVFQQRVRELELANQRELIGNEAEGLDLQERAQQAQLLDAQIAEQERLRALRAEEDRALLDFIAGRGEEERRIAEERRIQDLADGTTPIAGGGTSADIAATRAQDDAILAAIVAQRDGPTTPTTPTTPPTLTPGATDGFVPDQAFSDAVSNPGSLDDVVDSVVGRVGTQT